MKEDLEDPGKTAPTTTPRLARDFEGTGQDGWVEEARRKSLTSMAHVEETPTPPEKSIKHVVML